MSSLAEIGFSIRNQIKGFVSSDDERIDIEFIYKKVHDVRSLLIKEEIDKNKALSNKFYQRICCLEVICKKEECDGIPSGTTHYIVNLPPLEGVTPYSIIYFGNDDGSITFTPKNYSGSLYSQYSQYTGKKPYYTVIDDIAYLYNLPTDELKYICIVGILENPMDKGCYPLTENEEYPMPNNLVHKLELIVIKQLMSLLNIVPDDKNNATNNPIDDQDKVR